MSAHSIRNFVARRIGIGTIIVGAMVSLVGCGGPGKGNLEGTVTYQGKNIVMGSVTAIGYDKVPVMASIDENGHYILIDVPAGPVKLSVDSPEPPPDKPGGNPNLTFPEGRGADKKRRAAGGAPTRAKWIKLPPQCADPETSGIETVVKKGTTTTYNIEMK